VWGKKKSRETSINPGWKFKKRGETGNSSKGTPANEENTEAIKKETFREKEHYSMGDMIRFAKIVGRMGGSGKAYVGASFMSCLASGRI